MQDIQPPVDGKKSDSRNGAGHLPWPKTVELEPLIVEMKINNSNRGTRNRQKMTAAGCVDFPGSHTRPAVYQ